MDNILNITNSFNHPTRPGHTIFRFYEKQRADFFTQLLNEENLWFEQDEDIENDKIIYYFGVKNADLKLVNRKNYLVNAQFRKPTISHKYLRWVIYLFAIAILSLAIIGYIKHT